METLSRQDLQTAIQIAINTIVAKSVTKQEFNNAIQVVSQRICSRQEIQTVVGTSRDKNIERLLISIRDSQNFNRQLVEQIDYLNRRLGQIEQKLDNAQETIKTVQGETEAVMNYAHVTPLKHGFGQAYST